MSDPYLDLPSRLEDGFSEIERDIIINLQGSNERYADLKNKISKLKQKYSFIDKVVEGCSEMHLTAEEHAILKEYFHLKFELGDMERLQIYFRGHTDAFAYLKKINAI